MTYALSAADAPALAGRDVIFEHQETAPSTVAFTRAGRPVASIPVPAHGSARIDVRITPDASLSEGAVYGGYLVFAPGDGGPPLRVPFAGYKGDYQAVPATTPTSQGYPWLARQTGVYGRRHPPGLRQAGGGRDLHARADLVRARQGADIPFVLVHLNNFARRIRVEVVQPRAPAQPRRGVQAGLRPAQLGREPARPAVVARDAAAV